MSTYSRLRRVKVNEGEVYKFNDLIKPINEEFDARNFLFDDEIPNEYRVYDPRYPVEPTRDIKKLCERDLANIVRGDDVGIGVDSADDMTPNDDFGSTYCNLYNTYQHLDGTQKRDEFIDNLSRVFWFVRPNIYDNRVKFHNLMKVILRGDQEHVFESVKTLSDKIKSTYNSDTNGGYESEDIKKSLDRIKGKKSLSIEELNKELNTTKYTAYTLYEKSFEVGPFARSTKIFRINYKESLVENGFKHLLDIAYNKIYNSKHVSYGDQKHINELINESSQKLHKAIIDLYVKGQASKADLISTNNVLDDEGNTVIKKGRFVEVKMRDYTTDSYLSEFFSIYKDSNINPKYKSPEMLELYNGVITSLYDKININDGGILKDI